MCGSSCTNSDLAVALSRRFCLARFSTESISSWSSVRNVRGIVNRTLRNFCHLHGKPVVFSGSRFPRIQERHRTARNACENRGGQRPVQKEGSVVSNVVSECRRATYLDLS